MRFSSILVGALICFFSLSSFAQNQNKIIAQYYGIWTEKGQVWDQKFRADTPFDKLNRVYVSFGRIIKTNDGHFSVEFDGDEKNGQAIIDRVHAVNGKAEIFFALGGDGSANAFGGAANDPEFASNVLGFLTRHGFDGLDIDWEMGLNKADLNLLIGNLSALLHDRGFKLTLDVWPFVSSAYDMPFLRDRLDQINIMSYGAGLSLDYCVRSYIQAGFPAEKIIGGVETETNYNGGVDTLDGSIVAKANVAKQYHLAGMMGWRLDNDYAPRDKPTWPTYQGAIALWNAMQY